MAVTVAPVVADKPAVGVHVYVAAPDAVMLKEPPVHIEPPAGVTVIVGNGLIVTVATVDVSVEDDPVHVMTSL